MQPIQAIPTKFGEFLDVAGLLAIAATRCLNRRPNPSGARFAPRAPQDGHIARVGRSRRHTGGVIAPKTRNSRFQAGEPLFDFSNVLLEAADTGADRPQVFENQISNVVDHRGSLVGHHPKAYHEAIDPMLLRMARFRPILTEVLFIDMQPEEGAYEPLVGYIPLEQAQAVVDMVGHRLIKVSRVDLKSLPRYGGLPCSA